MLYAQVLAEKGFEIVFQGTHQIDQLPGSIPILTDNIPPPPSSDARIMEENQSHMSNEQKQQQKHEVQVQSIRPIINQNQHEGETPAAISPHVIITDLNESVTNMGMDLGLELNFDLNLDPYQPIQTKSPRPSNLIQIKTHDDHDDHHHHQYPNGVLHHHNQSPSTPSPKKSTPSTSAFVMNTPPKNTTPTASKGSPIPILIRRAENDKRRLPPVFPTTLPTTLAETDLEGNTSMH